MIVEERLPDFQFADLMLVFFILNILLCVPTDSVLSYGLVYL